MESDVVIIDLEDAVPSSEKSKAREQLKDFITKERRCALYIRVNALCTGLTIDDLNIVVAPGIDGIMLPKVEHPGDVDKVEWYLSHLESKLSLAFGTLDLIPLIENAIGLHNAYDIAKSSPRVKRLSFGGVDYSTDLGIKLTDNSQELFFARSQIVNASRAAGLDSPIDTVYPDIKNKAGLERDARIAFQLGFQGKMVIHPDQIESVNTIFAPSQEDVYYAQRVIAAFEEAEAKGQAAIALDNGKFIDYPVVHNARRILALVERITLRK